MRAFNSTRAGFGRSAPMLLFVVVRSFVEENRHGQHTSTSRQHVQHVPVHVHVPMPVLVCVLSSDDIRRARAASEPRHIQLPYSRVYARARTCATKSLARAQIWGVTGVW